MYVDIIFSITKVIPIMFERVTTRYPRYCTFYLSLTWVDHKATRYHSFNVLPHTIPTFSLSLACFRVICTTIPRVTFKFYKKMYINIFLKNIDDNLC